MKFLPYLSLAAIGLALVAAAAPVQAQQASATASRSNNDVVALSDWAYDPLYSSKHIRAEYLINMEVYGPEGDEIGNVEDAIISDGQIVAIVAEVGGLWDIGDVHIAVPWKQVKLVEDGIQIPVTEGNFEQYALFHQTSYINQGYLDGVLTAGAATSAAMCVGDSDQGVVPGACAWRLTALVDDYVVLPDGTGFGYVEDVIFSLKGQIQAVIVESTLAAYGYGTYAFPFAGFAGGGEPYTPVYTLPYGADQIGAVEPFQYDQFNGFWY